MQKEIPNITFKNESNNVFGIDIITINDLILKQKEIPHNPEKAHQLEFNMMVFYTKGTSKHLVDFIEYDVFENTIMYLSKGQVNAFRFNDSLDGYIILFTQDYFKNQLHRLPKNEIIRLFASSIFSPQIQIPENSNIKNYIKLFFQEFIILENTFNKGSILSDLFAILVSKLEELKQYQTTHIPNSNKLETFIQFKTLVKSNFKESRNAQFYASKLNITYKHLNIICKEILGTTAKSYIDEFIILEGKRNLTNSSIKSNELAYLLGFTEPTNFVKYFKKHTKLTPNEFKNQQT